MSGWISIHRKILNNILWQDKPFSKGQAWVDLLLITNHKTGLLKVKEANADIPRSHWQKDGAGAAEKLGASYIT